ncbi:MAG: D-alanyl-D-alanine carboxypeptidase family protein [Alphaproteobacteria bacterium]
MATLVLVSLFVAIGPPALGEDYEAGVEFAILVDYETGAVLYQHNANQAMPPASMAKLMTMFIVFEALRDGRLSLDDEFDISENAWRKGGAPSGTSTMFAEFGTSIAVRDLMRGVIVQSGNDAAIAIAAGLAGSEEVFAEMMNEAARRLGLDGSVFTNPTGLPDPAQHVTARDLSSLAIRIIADFPEHYAIYGEREFTWNGKSQTKRKTLHRMDIVADGMKTGFTEESGYGLIASAVQGDRRLVAVINGAESEVDRTREASGLLDWGFNAFTRVSLFASNVTLAEAAVFGGEKSAVGLRLREPMSFLLPLESTGRLEAEIVYDGPLIAPIDADEIVGTLRVRLDGQILATAQAVTDASVARGTTPQRARDALIDLFLGWQ